ncbi:Protein HOS4 [Colletotrichum siamense]|nr:Protein HOS4 [Colletotrichum siamense]
MDAQNAAGSDKPKPVAAAEKRLGNHQPDESKESTNNKPKSADESIKSPPVLPKDVKPSVIVSRAPPAADDAPAEKDSDAETIVLPGKDGYSPSKARKVKHEDRSDGEPQVPRKIRDASAARDADKDKPVNPPRLLSEGASSLGLKKKRLHDQSARSKDGSSGLSSAPASPPRRRSGNHSDSDTGADRRKSPKLSMKDRAKSTDRTLTHKRKAPKADSEDEAENRKARRQRISDAGADSRPIRAPREHKMSSSKRETDGHSGSRTRSVSPHNPRAHRRSILTQLPANSSNGLSYKKKRLPPPLQSTDYHSDESSASGSPHPRSSKLRNLSTPATAESNMSPAKIAPHKKHLDAHGQTFLARACARGEYDIAKQRLGERPEDLNVADYAGNTPLQIAAINGYEDIVKLLIDAGCNLDCVNYDKDTPLLDAVDNGHLGVVKLLLNAGVNPRKANVSGEEPLDRVSDDLDNAAEFRAALIEAKSRQGERRRTSEDHHSVDHQDTRSSLGPDSPRRSPAPSSSHASGRRAGTVRATKTSNYLLYMSLDDKTLRQAAAKGDEETVTRILQVKDGCDDSEAMVAAARGGHEVVIQLLLALGGANPDPAPVQSTNLPSEFATPMLAAIGQENIKVVRLLLDQANFDPTRRFKGETYYEIARRRQGTNWKDEEHMLKEAYDAYRKSHRDISKTKSPNRRERERERERERDRDQDRETKRQGRNELKDEARAHKRNLSSPSRDPESRKKISANRNVTSPKEKRRSDSFHDDQTSPKRGPGRPRKEDRVPTIAVSDREASPALSQKQSAKAAKRAESDVAAMSSEGEAVKPRRKLISKGELRGEREKNRRASMVSTTSSLKDPSSPRDPKHDDHPEKPKGEPLSEKYHDRTKALKRDESRDRLSVSGDHSAKRHRSSVTPPHSSTGEKEDGEVPTKRRRLDVDGKERRPKSTASPDDPHRLSREAPPRSKSNLRDHDDSDRRPHKSKSDSDGHRRESGKSSNSDKSSIHVKSEDVDIEMPDASDVKDVEEPEIRVKKERGDDDKRRQEEKERRREEKRQEERKRREAEAEEARKKEEERRQREAEEKKREAEQKRREAEQKEREAEEKRLKEEEEAKQREEERKRKAELERKRQEEEERQRREAEEKKRREEEERRIREEEEKKRREEEERKRKEEEARKQREEEERLRKEQLEREAAEEARRLREEEERKERERKERQQREEMERQRAAKEAEQRRIQQEQERLRLAKLPPLLRWLDGCSNPKTPELAAKFKHMQGVRFDTIRPQATGSPDGREQWILNTHAALLLGEKDLTLSRYTAWEHIPVSDLAKKVIWRLEADRYALITDSLYELGTGLPDYYGEGQDPFKMSYRLKEKLRGEAREKFLKLDMFFVKLSDLMFIVPNVPHLRSLKLSVEYRELPEDEAQLYGWKVPQKWKQDPDADRFYGFAPRNKYYVDGIMVEEQKPGLSATSSTPFPEKRAPRKGLQQIFPGDPDYARLCKEQGLEHLLNGTKTPALPNGGHLSPRSQSNATETSAEPVNGTQTASSAPAPLFTEARPLPNGVNGVSTSGSS